MYYSYVIQYVEKIELCEYQTRKNYIVPCHYINDFNNDTKICSSSIIEMSLIG